MTRGLALLELLIVLVALGLLLLVAVPEIAALRDRAAVRDMKVELRRLAAAQESYLYDHGAYSPKVDALRGAGFVPEPGVQIVVQEATMTGWSATASHADTSIQCFLFVRGAAPVGSATIVGSVHCS